MTSRRAQVRVTAAVAELCELAFRQVPWLKQSFGWRLSEIIERRQVAGCCRLRQVIIVVSQHNHLAGLPAQHHQNPQVSTHFEHP